MGDFAILATITPTTEVALFVSQIRAARRQAAAGS